jgi:hypothetical protein
MAACPRPAWAVGSVGQVSATLAGVGRGDAPPGLPWAAWLGWWLGAALYGRPLRPAYAARRWAESRRLPVERRAELAAGRVTWSQAIGAKDTRPRVPKRTPAQWLAAVAVAAEGLHEEAASTVGAQLEQVARWVLHLRGRGLTR